MKMLKEEKKILIKSYKGIGNMNDCLRVSTGEKAVMDKFIDALIDVDR